MRPKHIYLIRHGESIANVDPDVHGTMPDYVIPLTKDGKDQAFKAGEEIFKEIGDERLAVYVSPATRSRETWDAMQDARLFDDGPKLKDNVVFFREDVQLREQERGNFYSAKDFEKWEDERKEFGTFFYRYPDGESASDVWGRARDVLDDLEKDWDDNPDYPDHVLLVTHGLTMRVILMCWLKWTPEYFNTLKNPKNCEWVELKMGKKGEYKLKGEMRINDDEVKDWIKEYDKTLESK